DTAVLILATDATAFDQASRNRGVKLPGADLVARLAVEPGTAMISENFAELHHVGAGDSLTFTGPRGPVTWRVIGTIEDYSWNRGSVFVDFSTYVPAFEDNRIDMIDVFARPGRGAEAIAAARAYAARE